jgi:hypothetical protein
MEEASLDFPYTSESTPSPAPQYTSRPNSPHQKFSQGQPDPPQQQPLSQPQASRPPISPPGGGYFNKAGPNHYQPSPAVALLPVVSRTQPYPLQQQQPPLSQPREAPPHAPISPAGGGHLQRQATDRYQPSPIVAPLSVASNHYQPSPVVAQLSLAPKTRPERPQPQRHDRAEPNFTTVPPPPSPPPEFSGSGLNYMSLDMMNRSGDYGY